MKNQLLPFLHITYLFFWLALPSATEAQESKRKNAILSIIDIPQFKLEEENSATNNETSSNLDTRLSINTCIGYGRLSKNMLLAIGMSFGFSTAYSDRLSTDINNNQREYRLFPFLFLQYHIPISPKLSISPYFKAQAGYSWNRGEPHTSNSNLKGSGFFGATSLAPVCIAFTTKGNNKFFVSVGQVSVLYSYKKISDNNIFENTTIKYQQLSLEGNFMAFGLGFQKFF